MKRIRLGAAAALLLLGAGGCSSIFTRAEAVRWRHAMDAAADQRALAAAVARKKELELQQFDRVQWLALEEQAALAERQLRANGTLTEETSARLRQRYLSETDRLRAERLRLDDEWTRMLRLAQSGEENFLALAEAGEDVRRATAEVLTSAAGDTAAAFLRLLEESRQERAQAEVLSALRHARQQEEARP